MVALARALQLGVLQLVHGDVVAQPAWAPAEGSPEKWSLNTKMMKRDCMLMLFRIYEGHLGLKTKMRLRMTLLWLMTRRVRTKTFQLLNGTLRTLIWKKVPFLHRWVSVEMHLWRTASRQNARFRLTRVTQYVTECTVRLKIVHGGCTHLKCEIARIFR